MGKIEKHGTRNLRRFSFSFSRFLSFSSFACAISVYLVFWKFSVQISIHKLPMALVVCVVCCSPCIKVALLHSFFHFAVMLEFFFSLLLCVFLPSHPRAPVCFYLFWIYVQFGMLPHALVAVCVCVSLNPGVLQFCDIIF